MFGDESHASPTNWRAALGGFGFWKLGMPNDTEQSYYGAAIGQKGSSTRSELAGGIFNLTLPYRHQYATDSVALIAKANKIIAVAEALAPCNPFKKAWGLQRDGDLCTLAWEYALHSRHRQPQSPNSQKAMPIKRTSSKADPITSTKPGTTKATHLRMKESPLTMAKVWSD